MEFHPTVMDRANNLVLLESSMVDGKKIVGGTVVPELARNKLINYFICRKTGKGLKERDMAEPVVQGEADQSC